MFRAAVLHIFVDWVRVKGAARSSVGGDEEAAVGSGLQQERVAGVKSSGKGGTLGVEFINVSLEQHLSWEMASVGRGEVFGVEARGVSQQSSIPMTISCLVGGCGVVGRSQCFCENIGMFMNAVYRWILILALQAA